VPRVIWTAPALASAQRLYRFLATKDVDAARRAIKTIRAGVKVLAHQPQIGRPVDELDPVFREWLIEFGDSGYVVTYHFDGDTAAILAVRHQREAGY
jgi:plasmid stabilization system protein ParE